MFTEMEAQKLTDQILSSKKYRSLFRPTVERVVKDMVRRYPDKHVEKAVKRQLHQVWGAYYAKTKLEKLLVNTQEDIQQGKSIKEAITPLLLLQSSTRERLPILDQFYSQIFAVTGIPKTIVEPACGLNPLTYFWMNQTIKYVGYDIDRDLIGFMNGVFKLTGVQEQAYAEEGDILTQESLRADVGFLLKALTPLETQVSGCSLDVMKKMNCNYLVVSFPTKSISGKEKGMSSFYNQQFMDLVKNEPWTVTTLPFDTELVFILKKIH